MQHTLGGVSPSPRIECNLPRSQAVPDRRWDHGRRKALSELTIDELRLELLTSHLGGLGNQRAFEEAQATRPAIAIAMLDVDGLKALNDSFGHAAGDALLRVTAACLSTCGADAYHLSGDEFLLTASNLPELQEAVECARVLLSDSSIRVSVGALRGATFSVGIGTGERALSDAMLALCRDKNRREASGLRKRGELCGLTPVSQQHSVGVGKANTFAQAGPLLTHQHQPETHAPMNDLQQTPAPNEFTVITGLIAWDESNIHVCDVADDEDEEYVSLDGLIAWDESNIHLCDLPMVKRVEVSVIS